MHVGRSHHPFTLAPPPPESPFAVPILLSPFPPPPSSLCIFLHYRLRSLPERFPTFARIVSPKRASLYASLAVTVISRLAVCIPQINLLYLSNPSSSLFFYNSSQLSPNFTSIRSLAGEKSKFFEWIFPSRTKEEGACTHRRVSGLLDEYEVVGRGAIEVELNFRGNSIGVPSVI